MLRPLIILVFVLSGCAERPAQEALLPVPQEPGPPPGAEIVRMFVVTTRGKSPEQPYFFDSSRTDPSHISYDISVPPSHRTAEVEWPRGKPDPATDFVALARTDYNAAGFLRALPGGKGKVDISLYVHGYNTSYQEGVYRTALISADSDAGSVPVLFSWPSIATTTGYVADRDAADFSRAALADLIVQLARNPRIGRVFVIGHSMGGRLTMETLLQLRLAGRTDVLRRVEVVLADPDIDKDLFWEQARILRPMRVPLVVIVAPDDRALLISQILAAGRDRIGKVDVHDPEVIKRADAHGVRIVDVSAMDTDAIGHNRIVQIASLYNELPAGSGRIRKAGAYAVGALGLGLTRIGSEILDQ